MRQNENRTDHNKTKPKKMIQANARVGRRIWLIWSGALKLESAKKKRFEYEQKQNLKPNARMPPRG